MPTHISPRVARLLDQATPENVRYIKLGKNNVWWPLARETETLRLGFRQFDFQLCTQGDWTAAKRRFAHARPKLGAGKVTSATNQVRAFYELPETTLWFTSAHGDVWWGFAEAKVKNLYDGDDEKETQRGAASRKVIDGWRNTDVDGGRLRQDTMTTKITKVVSFQETICKPHGATDLLRIIRCEPSEVHVLAARAYDELTRHVGNILDQLHQDDFELLIELIFSSSGWRRVSPLGGIQKFFDMTLVLPTTGEKCGVQVKSQTSRSIFDGYVKELGNYAGYAQAFFVYHTPKEQFVNPEPQRVILWGRYEIAKQAIRAGLVEWVFERTT